MDTAGGWPARFGPGRPPILPPRITRRVSTTPGFAPEAHRRIQAAERLRAGDRREDHDLVVTARYGGPAERTEDRKTWKAIPEQAGMREVRVRDAPRRAGSEPPGRSGGPGPHEGDHDRTLCTCARIAHARHRRAAGLGAVGRVLGPRGAPAAMRAATTNPLEIGKALPRIREEGLSPAEARGSEPGWAVSPDRISSSDPGRSDRFNLHRTASPVKVGRLCTVRHSNSSCD
ncbi:hypothetical protein GCM10010517_36330 [Streptosporangium fragile]|uniref:Uncharacterized protein n=1 Tax=Streptosporangium fragile TaxID=46186 RepID=A0ABN3VYW2_9ACTN